MKATTLPKYKTAFFLAMIMICSSPMSGKLAKRSPGFTPFPVTKGQTSFPILFENKNVLPMAINRDGSIPTRRTRETLDNSTPTPAAVIGSGWAPSFPPSISPNTVKSVSRDVAWIGGDATAVVRTTDRGASWSAVGGAPITGDIYNIEALDANTALVTTTPGATTFIYRTTNGGTSWTEVFSQAGGFIDAIHMFDANNGIAVGDPVAGVWAILKTTDGGATWNPIATPLAQVGSEAGWNNSMSVVGATHIWFGTNSTRVYRSVDGGNTWTSYPTTFGSSVSISFVTTNNGITGGNPSGLNRTTDGGVTWMSQTEPGSGSISGMSAAGTRDLFLVQGSSVFHSMDRGVSWIDDYTPTPAVTWVDVSSETDGDSTSTWAVPTTIGSGGIGAYRDAVTPPPPSNDIRPILVVDPTSGSKRRANFSPQARYQNAGSASQSSIPVRMEILNIGGSVIYSNLQTIAGPLAFEAEATVTFGLTAIFPAIPGYYTARAISANPGDAVPGNDTITVPFYVPAQLSGTYTVGVGGQFTTLKAVADTLTHNDVAGAVTFELITNGTYNEPPLRIDGISYLTTPQPVIIKPASGVSPTIFVSDVADLGYVFQITNSSNFTIDGSNSGGTSRDLLVQPDTSLNLNTTTFDLQGVRNFTLKNMNIKGYYGAGAATAITMAQTSVTNRNVTFENLKIGRAFNDFYSLGGSSTLRDTNIVVRNCELGTFGSPTFQTALFVNNVDSFQFYNNVIDGVAISPFSGARAIVGLYLDGASRSSIYNNKVRNISNNVGGANAFPVTGIRVGGDGATSSNKVWNNMVWDITTSSSDTGASIHGIYMLRGSGDEVYFNSVHLRGSTSTNIVSAAFQMDSTTCTLKDNVLYNGRTDGTTGRSIALYRNNFTGASLTSDYNLLYAPGTTTGKLAAVRTTNYTDLASWTAATGQDGNSRRGNPQFTDPNVDLHISTSIPTPVESGGTTIAGITTDIDGNVRGGTPDVGADEGSFLPALATDMATLSINDPVTSLAKKTGTAFSPKATFGNVGLSTQTSAVRFRIYEAGNLVTPIYDQTGSTGSLPAGGSVQITFTAVSIASPGNYIAYGISELGTDLDRSNDTLTLAFTVKNPLAGVYNVPGDYPDLHSVASDLRAVGVSAAVTIQLTGASYTLPTQLVIDSVGGAGPSARVTFKPAAGVFPTITGTNTFAMILLNSADYIVFDGSNTAGGTTRDMTFSYAPSSTPAAVFYLLSNGTGRGCRGNIIKNCNIFASFAQNTVTNTTFGVASGGSTLASLTGPSDGPDNDTNTVSNNYFRKLRVGVWLRGVQTNFNDNNVISGNLVGPTSFGPDQIGRAGIVVQQQNNLSITQNEVRFVGGDLANSPSVTVSDRVGIGIGSDVWPASQTFISNSNISRNSVHDIVEERGASAVGIVVAVNYTITTTKNYIANNMVYGVRSNGATPGKQAVGIAISYGRGDTVVYNSVRLSGDVDPPGTVDATQSAVGIRISAAAVVNLFLKNNISSVDVNSNTGTLKHYSVVAPAVSYNWGTGASNNNDFHAAVNPQMVLGGLGTTVPYTDVATLAAWQTGFTPDQDLNSVAADPLFVSGTNLHITDAGSPASNAGVRVVTVPTDFDGTTRSTTTPDIGADEFASGGMVTLNVPVAINWNIVSLPVSAPVPDDSVQHIYTTSINAYAFAFSGGYVQRYTMSNGPGYWIKSNATVTQGITGTARDTLTVPIAAAWNMIGSISTSIDTSVAHVTPTPANLRASNYFKYNNGYVVAATIEPGLGYWVKANSAGSFFMHATGPAKPVDAPQAGRTIEDLNSITIRDANGGSQTLYFGADANGEIPVAMYAMPPAPPVGSFDARFASSEGGLMVQTHAAEVSEVIELPITIQSSAYPLTVTWKVAGTEATYELTYAAGSGGVGGTYPVRGEGTLKITNSAVELLVLKVTGGSGLPKEFALSQNYPNPFNPTTSIKYALPVDSKLAMEIYNVLGQRVRTLINSDQPAGYHSIEWNGTGNSNQQLASGIYFLQMSATGTNGKKFNEIRKLMMLK